MKLTERLILLFIIQLCFWACDNKPYSHLMSMADSLTNTNPDSAVIYLNKLKDHIETAPRSVQMYYQLLCIKANDRAYIPHSSDSIILPILNYYKQTDDLHLPETYYYAGRIYRDLGDAPQALDYFNNTLDALPSSSDSYSLKSKVYSQIGTLFLYQDIYDEALKMFKEAFHYDLLLEDSVGMSYDLRDMATSYRCLNQIDSAIYYYGKANDLALALHQQRFVSMIQSQMAGLYIQLKKYDLAISLDCADSKILKGYTKYFEKAKTKIVIDHHSSNVMYGDINFVNPVAPACSQVLIGMFKYFGLEITKDIATCIMTGIITDTGGFVHGATTETFEFAADILPLGVNISEIFRKTLHTKNKANFELSKRAMDRMEFFDDGKIAFTYITDEDQDEVNAVSGDHEGIVEIGKNIENVEVSIFLHGVKEKGYKISLRSLKYVNVAEIAIMLGGGGHIRAAGAYGKGSIEQIRDKVLKEVRKQLK